MPTLFWTALSLLLALLWLWPRLSVQLLEVIGFRRKDNMGSQNSLPMARRDIYHVAFLLRQKLPPELIPEIMDAAECWMKTSTRTSRHIAITEQDLPQIDEDNADGYPYLLSEPIGMDGLSGRHPVRRIVFTVTSKDQGYSWDDTYYGTYEHSWTWLEASIRDPNATSDRPRHSRRVITNVHAGQYFKTHTVSWSFDSVHEDERVWITTLGRGQTVELSAWARFPGWICNVRSAQIDVYTAAVR